MKKFLSMVIAAAMVFAMTSVSLAMSAGITKNFSKGGITGVRAVGDRAATYSEPKGSDDVFYSTTDRPAEYGSNVYIEFTYAGEYTLDMIRNLKIKTEWEQGGDLVESVDVVVLGVTRNKERRYGPVIRIKLKDSTETADADVVGTLKLSKKTGDDKTFRFKDAEVPVAFTVSYFYNYVTFDELLIDHDQEIIYPGDPHLLKFDYDDEVEFTFGREENEGTFTVDVSGQGKVLMLFDTMTNSAVEASNPDANMIFLGFNHVKFNRTGKFFYETETHKYIYELIDGVLKEVAGSEYDESEGGLVFSTRILGNYIISDIPLVAPDPAAAKAAELSGTDRYNPVSRNIKQLDA